jgi:hypothetical protein
MNNQPKLRVKITVNNIIKRIINNEINVYDGYDKVIHLGNSYFCYYIDETIRLHLAKIDHNFMYCKK